MVIVVVRKKVSHVCSLLLRKQGVCRGEKKGRTGLDDDQTHQSPNRGLGKARLPAPSILLSTTSPGHQHVTFLDPGVVQTQHAMAPDQGALRDTSLPQFDIQESSKNKYKKKNKAHIHSPRRQNKHTAGD
jgi:hypothetical protein